MDQRPAAHCLVVVDVDGVVSPVHPADGHAAWGDEVTAGNVFGPGPLPPVGPQFGGGCTVEELVGGA